MPRFINILLLGDMRVGKTSIMEKFVKNEFNLDYDPTMCIYHKEKLININNKQVLVQITDTMGLKTEMDLPIISKTIEMADGIFVVFDLSRNSTKEMAKFWLNQIKKQKNNKQWLTVTLLAHKQDLPRQISQDEIYQFSQQASTEIVETSSVMESNSVEEVIIKMAKSIISDKDAAAKTMKTTTKKTKDELTQSQHLSKKGNKSNSSCQIY